VGHHSAHRGDDGFRREGRFGLEETALPVTLTNTSNAPLSFDVTVEAVDASGTRIAARHEVAQRLRHWPRQVQVAGPPATETAPRAATLWGSMIVMLAPAVW
jgi:hypothetical protein